MGEFQEYIKEQFAKERQVGGDHYQLPIEPLDFIMANDIGFIEANVIKYVVRHANKNGRQDIEKAIDYLEKLLAYKYPKED